MGQGPRVEESVGAPIEPAGSVGRIVRRPLTHARPFEQPAPPSERAWPPLPERATIPALVAVPLMATVIAAVAMLAGAAVVDDAHDRFVVLALLVAVVAVEVSALTWLAYRTGRTGDRPIDRGQLDELGRRAEPRRAEAGGVSLPREPQAAGAAVGGGEARRPLGNTESLLHPAIDDGEAGR